MIRINRTSHALLRGQMFPSDEQSELLKNRYPCSPLRYLKRGHERESKEGRGKGRSRG